MNKAEMEEVLKQHRLWLTTQEQGRQAILRKMDLKGMNLSGDNFQWADLSETDLRWTDLRGANLYGSDLYKADLRGTDLRGANLTDANLNFACWPLWNENKGAKVDKKIMVRLAWQFCSLKVEDKECKAAQAALSKLAADFGNFED